MPQKLIVRYDHSQLDDLSIFDQILLHPVLKKVYFHRGIRHHQELDKSLRHLLHFDSLLHIHEAVTVLYHALKNQQRILIIGDYDVDGATSTALMVRVLKRFGALQVDYLIPDRFSLGYGLTPGIVELAASTKSPDLIVTVDNGIASVDGVAVANAKGISVVVTDHHLPGDVLPEAAAIVNPSQENDAFLSKNLAGVGVSFYVLLALRAKLREEGWFQQQAMAEPDLAEYLDLVALGTVADLVPMDYNNRILVYQGLQRIRRGYCCPGIKALMVMNRRSLELCTASDFSYVVSPRLNAAGRLEDMSLGVACLLADDMVTASTLAQQLNTLNEERKNIEADMRDEAFRILDHLSLNEKELPQGLCLWQEHWHPGVVGILASRVKDRLYRPTIAFAKQDETDLKGSARSVDGINMRNLLNDIATKYPGLITKFGGHAMAAGLTLPKQSYDQFKHVFNEEVVRRLEGKNIERHLMSDGELSDDLFSVELAELLRDAEPWGLQFPVPLFDGKFRIVEQRLILNKHLKLVLKQNSQCVEGIIFNIDTQFWPNEHCQFVQIAYHLDVDTYGNRRKVQLIIEHIEPV
jgi:single-stranded-DNA-specific exonuclease